MTGFQAASDYARDMVEKGETTTPNVEIVRMMGVRILRCKIPQQVRKELTAGVKAGRIGHLKKEGLRPEAYFHPNSRWKALELQDKAARESVEALRAVYACSDPFQIRETDMVSREVE